MGEVKGSHLTGSNYFLLARQVEECERALKDPNLTPERLKATESTAMRVDSLITEQARTQPLDSPLEELRRKVKLTEGNCLRILPDVAIRSMLKEALNADETVARDLKTRIAKLHQDYRLSIEQKRDIAQVEARLRGEKPTLSEKVTTIDTLRREQFEEESRKTCEDLHVMAGNLYRLDWGSFKQSYDALEPWQQEQIQRHVTFCEGDLTTILDGAPALDNNAMKVIQALVGFANNLIGLSGYPDFTQLHTDFSQVPEE